MSPPEVWGPSIWTLFHTLAEKVREDAYPIVLPGLFNIITKICKYLPCPECSRDATIFLAKINYTQLKTKREFINNFYLFHNYVNAKKRKPLFNYENIYNYKNYKLMNVINNFIINYQTKGNMNQLNESFQRQFIITDFKNFIKKNIKAFIPIMPIPAPISIKSNNIEINKEENKEDFCYKLIENNNNIEFKMEEIE